MSCLACEAQRKANYYQARAKRLDQQIRELARSIDRLQRKRRAATLAYRALNARVEQGPQFCLPEADLPDRP